MAKNKIMQVARALFNSDLPEDTILTINSGRYEFRNKGIDLYIDALARLNQNKDLDRNIIGLLQYLLTIRALLRRLQPG